MAHSIQYYLSFISDLTREAETALAREDYKDLHACLCAIWTDAMEAEEKVRKEHLT